MAVMQRPILVGGISLSLVLWLLQNFHHSLAQLGDFTVLGAIIAGGFAWWWQQTNTPETDKILVTPTLDRPSVEKAISATETAISQLQTETENADSNLKETITLLCQTMAERVTQLKIELDRPEIRLAITGGKGTGKTTLMRLLQSAGIPEQQNQVIFTETPALLAGNADNITGEKEEITAANFTGTDLVLFLISADLTEPEYQIIQQLNSAGVRTILVWNKQDLYLPEERNSVLQQLQTKLNGILNSKDVISITAAPVPVKVRRHLEDGSWQEWMEQPAPDISQLTSRCSQILQQEAGQLILAATLRSAKAIKAEARTLVNKVRRERTLPIIEQAQWIAAAAAFANPVPALDLLATGAITGQLIVDIGEVYQQKLSLDQAKIVAGTMAEFMLKFGLVELSTQTVTSILKSNAITFVAGGAVQGVSAAYLTRIAGLSLIEYFQEQENSNSENRPFNLEELGKKLQGVFQQNQRAAFLQSFVKPALAYLTPNSAKPASSET